MNIPLGIKILIPEEKLLTYILSETHAVGKFKAKFFRNLGFNETNIPVLKKTIERIVRENEIAEQIQNIYGAKYLIEGEINTPTGKVVNLRTIWIIEKNQNFLRFVTMYPV